MKTILELDEKQARDFLLANKSYAGFDLPEYFNFAPMLQEISAKLGNYDINYFFAKTSDGKKNIDPRDQYKVNHKIFGNKELKFFELCCQITQFFLSAIQKSILF